MRETDQGPCAAAADGTHVTVPCQIFVESDTQVFDLVTRDEIGVTEGDFKIW